MYVSFFFKTDARKTRGVPSADDKDADRDPADMPSRVRDPNATVTTGMLHLATVVDTIGLCCAFPSYSYALTSHHSNRKL